MRVRHGWRVLVCAVLAAASCAPLAAQDAAKTERELRKIRAELREIGQERRKLEGQRGEAAVGLRRIDERLGRSSRELAETEAALQRERQALAELQAQRTAMGRDLDVRRQRLGALLRGSYALGNHAPLKLLLAQDRVGDAQRALAYYRYAQRDHARQIEEIGQGLRALETTEAEIAARTATLVALQEQQKQRTTSLARDRRERASAARQIEQQYADRQEREKALGQDARSLERLLANLRAAARRAEAERKAAEQRAAREAAAQQGTRGGGTKTPPRVAASAPAPKVGGLGWPASGDLLARYGGKLPDGRTSSGVLIGASAGAPVTAVADGTVVFSEWMTGYGLILIIDHGNGYMSLYAHNESLLRDAGDRVKRGDAVARVGSSGGHGRPALYFELRRNGQPVDPTTWLQRR
ncbi:peptidoglycan DD-metalloendopeptidase family protein [Xanthomonas sp. XNM01]|uniref:murein hydrolase activator EnvC family protein n=1 Tax=Xanthomonas sp. XNM01 TaxID=2769289 RepID=UPI001CE10011|nr:peptidoglycan DD-metalloendopeptidase family protein [Xanthomonas sp. XNM01]